MIIFSGDRAELADLFQLLNEAAGLRLMLNAPDVQEALTADCDLGRFDFPFQTDPQFALRIERRHGTVSISLVDLK